MGLSRVGPCSLQPKMTHRLSLSRQPRHSSATLADLSVNEVAARNEGTQVRKIVWLLFSLVVCGESVADNNDGVNALGRGNYEQALIEFRPGAELGDVSAQNFLAYTYLMLEDYVQAYAWYHMSAECGSLDADIDREILSRKMSDTQLDKARQIGAGYLEHYCFK